MALVLPHPAPQPLICPASDSCRPASELLDGLGLPHHLPWRWLHIGPIDTRQTLIATHGSLLGMSQQRPPPPPPNSHQRNALDGRTWPELRGHPGYRLDLFGLNSRPPVQAQYLAPARLWVVYAVAYRSSDGPHAVWAARLDRPCELTYHFGAAAPTATVLAELGRCYDLLLGRRAHSGRRSLAEDTAWRSIAEAAEAGYAVRPAHGWGPIASRLNVDVRTLRKYRRLLRLEQASPAIAGPTLMSGEC